MDKVLAVIFCLYLFFPTMVSAIETKQLEQFEQKIKAVHADLGSDVFGRAQALVGEKTPLAKLPDLPQINDATPHVILTDLRIVLAQLSLFVGGNNQLRIMRAQGSDAPVALAVESGRITLSELKDHARVLSTDQQLLQGDALAVPIVIWPDAQLVLQSGDDLQLSRDAGAFLVNFGGLYAQSARIRGVGGVNPQDAEFSPFVATAGAGYALLAKNRFQSLGFGKVAAYSGLSFLAGGVFPAQHATQLSSNQFFEVGELTLRRTQSTRVEGNVFRKSKAIPIAVKGAVDAQIIGNVFLGGSAASTLRVTEGARGTRVAQNVLLEGKGSGIDLRGADSGTEIEDNLIWSQKGVGISVDRSDCVQITGNSVIRSGQKGITLTTSQAAVVSRNVLYRNGSAGLLINQQPTNTLTSVLGNVLAQNRVGLSLASAADLLLGRNDFSDQFPRLVDGDLQFESSKIFQDLQGEEPVEIHVGGIAWPAIHPLDCPSNRAKEG